jgi:E3 ubiquitin-protein ligase RNF14
MGQAQPAPVAGHNGQQDPNDLNLQQQAWIRHFVQLALNDEEDLVDWDSDEE